MLDMSVPLGRPVATPSQVLGVIRPYLRIMRAAFRGCVDAGTKGELSYDHRHPSERGNGNYGFLREDGVAFVMLATSMHADAMRKVKAWAANANLVFDGPTMEAFVMSAIEAAMRLDREPDQLPETALYLA